MSAPTSLSPDFAGFRDAQKRLRERFGQVLTFYTPRPRTWPANTQLDPERGEPYDPAIVPASGGGFDEVQVNVSVVQRELGQARIGMRDTTVIDALGSVTEGNLALIVDIDDFHLVRNATEVEHAENRYEITQKDHDYLGPVDRYVFFCKKM